MCALVVVVFHQRERGSLPIYFSGLYNWRFWGTVGTCVCMCRRFIWRLGEARAQRTRQSGRGIFPFSPSRALFFYNRRVFQKVDCSSSTNRREESLYIYIYPPNLLQHAIRNNNNNKQQTTVRPMYLDDIFLYVLFVEGGKTAGWLVTLNKFNQWASRRASMAHWNITVWKGKGLRSVE